MPLIFRPTTPLLALLATALMAAPASLAAQTLTDDQLAVVPRTAEEAARIKAVTAPTTTFDSPEAFEQNPGGGTTVRRRANADAFSLNSANMDFAGELDFKLGNALFRKLWVSSPSSTLASDGLGPLYNARSCQRCHLKDGRGHPPQPGEEDGTTMFLRVSVPGGPDDGIDEIRDYIATLPEPTYGGQMQDHSLPGIPAEYHLGITYDEIPVPLSGGESASLRAPTYTAENLGWGPLAPDAMLSPRVAPQMIGLGLVEAIPAADILAHADEDDADGDGISGRANIVWSLEYDKPMLGRFGLKAGVPTIKEQSASAFAGDIGISSPLHPDGWGDCVLAQAACQQAPHGDQDARGYEIDAEGLDLVTFYARNLAVPAREGIDDPQVLRGKQLFYDTGCTSCHTPKFVTARLEDRPEQSFQLIWPYSDFLLHDMGEGLADHRPEARATGTEWRTAPLWGIGLTKQVSGHTQFLHDGRARNLLEAVLWHGGEAQAQRDAVIEMAPSDRAALIRYLESL